MPEVSFQVEKAEAEPFAVSPLLVFKLRISQVGKPGIEQEAIQSIALHCQIRIEPTQRKYGEPEQCRLLDLFGEKQRWSQTLRSMLWTHSSVGVPGFTGSTVVDLPVPCTYDFNVATTKYFYALEDGEIPLCLLFSGTIFYTGDGGALRIAQISWEKEASFRLSVSVWKRMMEIYYPNTAWLCLRQDVFDRLYQYKMQRGLPTWEQAVEELLCSTGFQPVPGASGGRSSTVPQERLTRDGRGLPPESLRGPSPWYGGPDTLDTLAGEGKEGP